MTTETWANGNRATLCRGRADQTNGIRGGLFWLAAKMPRRLALLVRRERLADRRCPMKAARPSKGAASAASSLPNVLPFESPQPTPTSLWIDHVDAGAWVTTFIIRTWAPGDTEKCRLCPRCGADDNTCVIRVGRYVDPKDGAKFSVKDEMRRDA